MSKNLSSRGSAEGRASGWPGRLLALGGVLVALSFALGRWQGRSPSAGIAGALGNLGWLMLASAVLFLVLGRQARSTRASPRSPLPRQVSLPPPSPGLSSGLGATGAQDSANSRFVATSQFAPSTAPGELDEAPSQPPRLWSPAVFKVIEWRRFEVVVETLFNQAGYITQRKRWGGAGEMDLALYSSQSPSEVVGMVRCVHGRGKQVGMEKVRDFLRTLAQAQVSQGHYVTATVFTADGMDYARTHQVTPLNVAGLLDMIGRQSLDEQKVLLKLALEGEYWRPTCVQCGIKLVDRVEPVEGRPYWGCANAPRCQTVMPRRLGRRH